ncbi:MAG: hypothetical protein GWN71_24870, partial [Gammaproteobacteria bacterium]|nr:penicillin acylase family protein [Gemmatimonadota bacterium]NIU76677.1 hypothetical protein [Gammaproteobacteria bacterium]
SAGAAIEAASDEAAMVMASLSSGINAGMAEAAENLPIEFDLLLYEPEPWTPQDTAAVWKWR